MNEIIEKERIEDMIYEIRGKQVMLDSDLAKLYECANGTKDINSSHFICGSKLEPQFFCFFIC